MGETVLKQLTNETNRMLDQVIRDLRRLPYDAEIEYLESTGTQYIDTGWIPSSASGYSTFCRAAYVGGDSGGANIGCLFGVTSNNGHVFYQINKTSSAQQFRLITNNGDVFWTRSPSYYQSPHDYDLQANRLYMDGALVVTGSGQAGQSSPLMLFARYDSLQNAVNQLGRWRLYACVLSGPGGVARSFVPVRVGHTGYLFDRVSGQLVGNAGTGEFVLGPDKKTTRDYIQDGLVAMWDGIENTRERA